MRKIEKETLQIINQYKNDEYLHYEKLIDIREKEIKEELENKLELVVNKKEIINKIEQFKKSRAYKVDVNFDLSIRSYYTDYQYLYDIDEQIKEYKKEMENIENTRNYMKLVLQNNEIKSPEFQNVINKLKGNEINENRKL